MIKQFRSLFLFSLKIILLISGLAKASPAIAGKNYTTKYLLSASFVILRTAREYCPREHLLIEFYPHCKR